MKKRPNLCKNRPKLKILTKFFENFIVLDDFCIVLDDFFIFLQFFPLSLQKV